MDNEQSNHGDEEAIRLKASDWFARIRAPDGEKDRGELDAWYAADPAHAAAFDRLVRRWDQTAFLANTELGRTRGLKRARRSFPNWSKYAAAAAAVAMIGSLALWRDGDASGNQEEAGTVSRASGAENTRLVILPDGSRASLGEKSELRSAYTGGVRHVQLTRGLARFEVAHDPARPFEVEAGAALVVARGTIFDVNLYDDGRVQVYLLQGSVEIQRLNARSSSLPPMTRRTLAPGQQLVIPPDGPVPEPSGAVETEANATPRMITFDGTRLADAVQRMSGPGTPTIRLAEPGLADLRLTGAFREKDLEGFGKAVASAFQLELRRLRDGTMLLERGTD